MDMLRSLLVVLLFLAPAILADSFSFNTTLQSECLAPIGCAFDDVSIWINHDSVNDTVPRIPGSSDSVTVAGVETSDLLIFTRANVEVLSLVLQNTSFVVASSTVLSAASIDLREYAHLTVNVSATVVGNHTATFTLTPLASFTLNEFATFNWNGSAIITGTISTDASSVIYSSNFTYAANANSSFLAKGSYDILTVLPTVLAVFPNGLEANILTAGNGSTVSIEKSFSGRINVQQDASVVLREASILLNSTTAYPPINGLGAIFIISSSEVVINSAKQVHFNGTLILDGVVTIDITNITLPKLNFTESSSVVISGNGLGLTGRAYVPGNIFAYGAHGVYISGTIILVESGSVAVTSSRLVIAQNGSLVIPNVTSSLSVSNSQLLVGGLLHSDVVVRNGSSLNVTSPLATIVGDLTNEGSLNISTSNALEIYSGDYTQDNGTFVVGLYKEGKAALTVHNGSIKINGGDLRYTIKDRPFLKSAKFVVATAGDRINGTFAGKANPLEGSVIDRQLTVQYDAVKKSIYINYNFSPKDVAIWMWIVLAVVVALVLIVTVAVIVKCRKRSQYESLHSHH